MKSKNLLKAKMSAAGIPVLLLCRRTKRGFRWYGNGNVVVDEYVKSLQEAKDVLVTTYPPERYGMKACWLSKYKV